VTYSWALIYDRYPEDAKAQAIQGLLRWSLTEGQAQSETMGYIPLPANAAEAALIEVETIGG
jgi:phosphate transport system substrate-binding protein